MQDSGGKFVLKCLKGQCFTRVSRFCFGDLSLSFFNKNSSKAIDLKQSFVSTSSLHINCFDWLGILRKEWQECDSGSHASVLRASIVQRD